MALDRKKQQFAVLGLGAAGILGLFYLVFGVLGPKQPAKTPFGATESGLDVSIIADRTSAAGPEMSWVTSSRAQLENLTTLVEDLQASLDAQKQEGDRQLTALRAEYDEIIVQMADNIADLEDVTTPDNSGSSLDLVEKTTSKTSVLTKTPDYSDTGSEFIQQRTIQRTDPTSPGPMRDVRREITTSTTSNVGNTRGADTNFGHIFTLTSAESTGDGRRNTLRNYIPAGSYVEAVVLSGADAATNVVNRENRKRCVRPMVSRFLLM